MWLSKGKHFTLKLCNYKLCSVSCLVHFHNSANGSLEMWIAMHYSFLRAVISTKCRETSCMNRCEGYYTQILRKI